MRRLDLAEELRCSIDVISIRQIVFGIGAAAAGKHAIGADLDKTGASLPAETRQTYGQHRVDRNRSHRIGRCGPADGNTIDNDVRTNGIEQRRLLLWIFDIADRSKTRSVHGIEQPAGRFLPNGSDHLRTGLLRQAAEHRIAEQPRRAKHKHLHGIIHCKVGIRQPGPNFETVGRAP